MAVRVLIVNPAMAVYGGAELVIVKLANYMTRHGIENALLTTSLLPEIEKDIDKPNIILSRAPNISLEFLPVGQIYALSKGVRGNSRRFDVINIHNYPADMSVSVCRRPVVWMCNEPLLHLTGQTRRSLFSRVENKLCRALDKRMVRKHVTRTVVADEFNAQRFRDIYGLEPAIINYGIDHDFYSAGDGEKAREKFALRGCFALIQVGAIQAFKNQLDSIKTLEKIRGRIPNAKLLLAGLAADPAYVSMLKDYIRANGLDDDVIFTGHLPREEVRDLYHACHVALFPIKSQGGWLSPFEALCAGIPIVVSNEMTASSIIKQNSLGQVTDNYPETVAEIWKNPDQYRQMAARSGEWVRRNLSWDNFCEKMVNVFEEVCGQ